MIHQFIGISRSLDLGRLVQRPRRVGVRVLFSGLYSKAASRRNRIS
jgi:hypothetical protein